MKKLLFSVLAVIMIVSNTGCTNKSSVVTPITTGLSFTAQIGFNDTKTECKTVIEKDGKTTFTVMAPAEINGLTFVFSAGKATVNYKGLEYNFSGELSEYNAVNMVYKVLENADKNSVIAKDDAYVVRGNINNTDYVLQLGATGLPIKITAENGLEVIIKNATIM